MTFEIAVTWMEILGLAVTVALLYWAVYAFTHNNLNTRVGKLDDKVAGEALASSNRHVEVMRGIEQIKGTLSTLDANKLDKDTHHELVREVDALKRSAE